MARKRGKQAKAGAANGATTTSARRSVARNRRATHDYDILERAEAGLVLSGSEIKSLRAGKASIQEAYVRPRDGEMWLVGAHISPYEAANQYNHDPKRDRKLLLHRREIRAAGGGLRPEIADDRAAPPLHRAGAGQAGDRRGAGAAALRQARHTRRPRRGTADAGRRASLTTDGRGPVR